MRLSALALSAVLVGAAPVAALADDYTIDKSHAVVSFEVSHLGFSNVHGFFRDFDAQIAFDENDMAASSVSFAIQADSIDTLWADRDKHLMSGDFLDVANHPEITFVSKSVEMTGDNTALVTGDVTIVGVTQEETFEAVLNAMGPHPFNDKLKVAGFTITGVIDRTDYGMNWGVPAIGAAIHVTIDMEITAPATGS